MNKPLTIKQEKFCQGLFIGLTQIDAYKQAYEAENMSDAAIYVEASRLIDNPNVALRVEQLKDELKLRNMVTIERVLSEYAKIGFYDPRKLLDDEGKPKDISQLDDDIAGAVVGLDLQEVYEGFGDERVFTGYTKKYKLADKKGALDSMSKFLGMFTDKVESVNTNLNYEIPTTEDEIDKRISELINKTVK